MYFSKFPNFRFSHRIKLCCGAALIAWLVLYLVLPPEPGRVVGFCGLLILGAFYILRADDPKSQPKWGCFLLLPHSQNEIHIERDLAKLEVMLAVKKQRQTLLIPVDGCNTYSDELLRPLDSANNTTSTHLLRPSDKVDEQ